MSIKTWLSTDGVEELFTAPTLKELCLYQCVTNKDILTRKVEADENLGGNEKLDWEKFRLKEPIQKDLLEALLEAGEKYLFMLTPNYEPVLAAIRMCQPEHLVKVHVSNTTTLEDRHLELLLSGKNVNSLDIDGCESLTRGSLSVINKFGSKFEFLRLGDSVQILPDPAEVIDNSSILKTPRIKNFIVGDIRCLPSNSNDYWRFLLQDFIENLEELRIIMCGNFDTLDFLESAQDKLTSLTLSNCDIREEENSWRSLFLLKKLKSLDLVGSSFGQAFVAQNVVRRLQTALPELAQLFVDPGFLQLVHVDLPFPGDVSASKPLEVLGIVDNDEDELEKAYLLAANVISLGTAKGARRSLEYFSNRPSSGHFESSLQKMFPDFDLEDSFWRSATAATLIVNSVKLNGDILLNQDVVLRVFTQLLRIEVVSKQGKVFLDLCIDAVSNFIDKLTNESTNHQPHIITSVTDILWNLDGKLVITCFGHYLSVVPKLMLLAAEVISEQFLIRGMDEDFKKSLKRLTRMLEKGLRKDPVEMNELWRIASVFALMNEFCSLVKLLTNRSDRSLMIKVLSRFIKSLKIFCVASLQKRAAFQSEGGLAMVLKLVSEFMDGYMGLSEVDSMALIEILRTLLKDTTITPEDLNMTASTLEKLLLWINWDNGNATDMQSPIIVNMLNFIESHQMSEYKPSIDVKKIMMQIKNQAQ